MKATLAMAAVAAGMAGSAGASTVEPGYSWTADDGSLSMFVSVDEGEDFYDLIEDGYELALEFLIMTNATFWPGVGDDGIYAELYHDNGSYDADGSGDTCNLYFEQMGEAFLSFETGLLTTNAELSVWELDDTSCGFEPIYAFTESFVEGTWAAVGGAPTYPFPAAVPLPASVLSLLAGLMGLGFAAKRRAARPRRSPMAG